MDRRIKVTIITVCYNSEQTIRRCIESVLHQTYENIEYIIVDGASTDGTMKIVKEYEPLFQGRLRWVSEPDDGIYYAMNKGIDMATGELIGIINSDDYYERDAVEYIINSMTGDKYLILYGAMRSLRQGVEESISICSHIFLKERMINHPSCFVKKAVYDDFGKFDTQYISAADYDFMLRVSEKKEVYFKPVYHIIANFSLGGFCASGNAYIDLIKVRHAWSLLSEREYKKIIWKDKLVRLLRSLRNSEPI